MRTIIILISFVIVSSCQKKSADTPLATIPERLDIQENAVALINGEEIALKLIYYNEMGVESALPTGILWESNNIEVAVVNPAGLVSSLKPGQAIIHARYKDASDSVTVNVVNDDQSVASIVITPDPGSVLINQNIVYSANALNLSGAIIPGISFTWEVTDPLIAVINENGEALTISHGTTTVIASAQGVSSAPVELQVIRSGNFSGSGSKGVAILRITNGILKLETSSDFSVSTSPPDLRMYLTNNKTSISGGEEVATLNQRTGAQTWNINLAIKITDYRYVLVWCKQFGGSYGVADLGE